MFYKVIDFSMTNCSINQNKSNSYPMCTANLHFWNFLEMQAMVRVLRQDNKTWKLNILWSRIIPFSYAILLILYENMDYLFQKLLYDVGDWNQALVVCCYLKARLTYWKHFKKVVVGQGEPRLNC